MFFVNNKTSQNLTIKRHFHYFNLNTKQRKADFHGIKINNNFKAIKITSTN